MVGLAGVPRLLYEVVNRETLLKPRPNDGGWDPLPCKSYFAKDISAFIRRAGGSSASVFKVVFFLNGFLDELRLEG